MTYHLNYPELRSQCRQKRHILGLLPPNVHERHLFSAKVMLTSMGLAMALFIAGCLHPPTAHANVIDQDQAICAIIGEAENQGYEGMLAVAGAIRNRGTLQGVFGVHAPRVKSHLYSRSTQQMATSAWMASLHQDITHGATHWENIHAFGKPWWAKDMVETFRYKDHVFYAKK